MDNISKIKKLCKKHQTWERVFILWCEKYENLNISLLEEAFSLFLKHKNKLKSDININFAKDIMNDDKYPGRLSIVETFLDKITETILDKEKIIFIKSLKTKKYKKLFNSQVEKEIGIILDNDISKEALRSQFFIKLASYSSAIQLLSDLRLFKNTNSNWTKNHYLTKLKGNNIEIVENNEGSLLVEVKDFKSMEQLGATAWCIARSEDMFNMYVNRDYINNKQYIYYNFDLPIDDIKSIIGMTVDMLGNIMHSHLKDDSPTEQYILDEYRYRYSHDERIVKILPKVSHEIAFELVCCCNMVNLYDEYKIKVDKYISNEKYMKCFIDMGDKINDEMFEKITTSKWECKKNVIFGLIQGSIDSDRVERFVYLLKLYSSMGYSLTKEEKSDITLRVFKNSRPKILNLITPKIKENIDFDLKVAVHFVSVYDNLDLLKMLMIKCESKIMSDIDIFFEHMNTRGSKVTKWLIENKKVDVSKNNNSLLKKTVHRRNNALIDLLLSDYSVCIKLNKVWCQKNLSEKQFESYKKTKAGQ